MRKRTAVSILDRIRNKKILVIGDIMLDEYLWGTVDRISPEAPVPVVKVQKKSFALGGAANVALNTYSLGAKPILVGVIGNDDTGRILKSFVKEKGMAVKGIFTEKGRTTVLKKRVFAQNQQVVRVDIEETKAVGKTTERRILNFLRNCRKEFSSVIIEDYNKGLLTRHLISRIISFANKKRIPVTVDPKFENFYSYENVALFKPNIRELQRVCESRLSNRGEIQKALKKVQKKIKAKAVLLTLGNKGMVLLEKGKIPYYVKPHSIDVYDVTGAGDTVISALTLALASGISLREATRFASVAAAIEVTKLGVATVNPDEIIEFCSNIKKSA